MTSSLLPKHLAQRPWGRNDIQGSEGPRRQWGVEGRMSWSKKSQTGQRHSVRKPTPLRTPGSGAEKVTALGLEARASLRRTLVPNVPATAAHFGRAFSIRGEVSNTRTFQKAGWASLKGPSLIPKDALTYSWCQNTPSCRKRCGRPVFPAVTFPGKVTDEETFCRSPRQSLGRGVMGVPSLKDSKDPERSPGHPGGRGQPRGSKGRWAVSQGGRCWRLPGREAGGHTG